MEFLEAVVSCSNYFYFYSRYLTLIYFQSGSKQISQREIEKKYFVPIGILKKNKQMNEKGIGEEKIFRILEGLKNQYLEIK